MRYIITERQLFKILNENPIDDKCEKGLYKILNRRTTTTIFKPSIEKMLDPLKKDWIGDKEKYVSVLKLIGKSDSEIDKILNIKFVYDENGNWKRINKLNTNYSDISVLVMDIFKSEGKSLCEIQKNLESGDTSDLKDLANAIMSNPENYYKQYLQDDDEKYTQNNKRNTEIGDKAELEVISFLEQTYGWKLIYQSVEGSPIDTKLSIDIIMETKEGKIVKIQVKKVGIIKEVPLTACEQLGMRFKNKKRTGGYSVYSYYGVSIRPENLDYVAYVGSNGVILVVDKYSPVTVVNNKCLDQSIDKFPSNPRGSFYVDYESIVAINE